MKTEIWKQLSDILDTRQSQKQAAASQAAKREDTAAKNLADFNSLKEKVIKPAFQEIVEIYNMKGVRVQIVEEDEYTDARGRSVSASIALDLSGEEYPVHRAMKPEFKFIFDKRNRSVSLYTSTESQAGPAGSGVPLDSVTADWIQNAFVSYASA